MNDQERAKKLIEAMEATYTAESVRYRPDSSRSVRRTALGRLETARWIISLVPEGTLWRRYGKLEVFLPPKDYILALKLLAGRRKDTSDILALCQQLEIQSQEQAQALVDRYIPDPQVQRLNHVGRTLKRVFGG